MKNFAYNIALLGLLAAAYVTGSPQLMNIAAVLLWVMSTILLLVSLLALVIVGVCTQADHPKLKGLVESWQLLFKRSAVLRWVNRFLMLLIVIAAAALGLTYSAAFFGLVQAVVAIPCTAICRSMIESSVARGEEAAQ